MTHDELLRQLLNEYEARRLENAAITEARYREACAACPGLEETLNERTNLMARGIQAMLENMRKDQVKAVDIRTEMDALLAKARMILKQHGFAEDYLQPVYTCPICEDKGYLYEPEQRMCECLKRELTQRELKNSGIPADGPAFERFSEAVYGDADSVPHKLATVAKRYCESYADACPNAEVPNVLITGNSGLGKTYLLQCIARRLTERMVPVTYVSAYRMIEAIRQAWFNDDPEEMNALMSAPVLIIDDLGTEPLINNLTITHLFNLLNERAANGLCTLISSNLPMSEIVQRYTERIASRLQDKRQWKHLTLQGDDIRTKLK